MDQLLTRRNTVIFVAVLALWRLYLSGQLQLHPDEAYYWLWSRRLDLSYFDHPPMVAYFIWLTTRFSETELWVRLSGSLVILAISSLIWKMALQLSNSVRVAAGSVMVFNAYPLTVLGLMAITPDVHRQRVSVEEHHAARCNAHTVGHLQSHLPDQGADGQYHQRS